MNKKKSEKSSVVIYKEGLVTVEQTENKSFMTTFIYLQPGDS